MITYASKEDLLDHILHRCSINWHTMCWEWQGSLDDWGYGNFNGKTADGKRWRYKIHRIVFEICSGKPIPKGFYICHKCDNPKCTNPEHLYLGTPKENSQDCVLKGRFPDRKGEKNHSAVLTREDVLDIRRRESERRMDVAKEYGVSPEQIGNIIAGRSWSWLAAKEREKTA